MREYNERKDRLERQAALSPEGRVLQAAISEDGSKIATFAIIGEKTLLGVVWDALTHSPMTSLELAPISGLNRILSSSFSPDGSKILFFTESAAYVWEAKGRLVFLLEPRGVGSLSIVEAALSPDGSMLVAALDGVGSDQRDQLLVSEIGTGKRLARIDLPETPRACAFGPDGKHILVDVSKWGVWRHEVPKSERRFYERGWPKQFEDLTKVYGGIVHSRIENGKRIVWEGPDKPAFLLDARSGKILSDFGGVKSVRSVSINRAGDRAVVCSEKGVYVWAPDEKGDWNIDLGPNNEALKKDFAELQQRWSMAAGPVKEGAGGAQERFKLKDE